MSLSRRNNNFCCLYLLRKYDIQHVNSKVVECDFQCEKNTEQNAKKRSIELLEKC